jgi:hypothetical protein
LGVEAEAEVVEEEVDGGGRRKKQGSLKSPLMANRSEVLVKSKWR